jgi:hypothetical protein
LFAEAQVEVCQLTDRSDYQEYAGWCICEAEQTTAPELRALFLMIAQAWMRLADQYDQVRVLSSQASGENVG